MKWIKTEDGLVRKNQIISIRRLTDETIELRLKNGFVRQVSWADSLERYAYDVLGY
jgi:hypothetical protein